MKADDTIIMVAFVHENCEYLKKIVFVFEVKNDISKLKTSNFGTSLISSI